MERIPRRIEVRGVMSSPAECIGPDESIHVAAARMRACNVGMLVVRSGGGPPSA